MRNILGPLLLSATFAACAPAGGVASGPVPLDTIIRPMLRPVPLTHAYRAALASGTLSVRAADSNTLAALNQDNRARRSGCRWASRR